MIRGGIVAALMAAAALVLAADAQAAKPPAVDWPTQFLGEHGGSEDPMLELRRRRPVPSFTLTDQHGRPLTEAMMQGKWTVLFFGYTHCPDYCPTTLAAIRSALHRLKREDPGLGDRVQVLFISLDPFRDTPSVLNKYVAYFGPLFTGATGSAKELQRFTRLMGINYDYTDTATGASFGDILHAPPGDYAVDHTADFYVFDDHARLLQWVEPPHTPRRVEKTLKHILQQYGGWDKAQNRAKIKGKD